MDHWTQAEDALLAMEPPMQPFGPAPGLPNSWMKAAGLGSANVIDWWWNDDGTIPGGGGPARGLNGSAFHMGQHGQVIGDPLAFTDRQVTEQVLKTTRAHVQQQQQQKQQQEQVAQAISPLFQYLPTNN